MSASPDSEGEKKGLINAAAACALWGVLPIFWKLLSHLSPATILAGRVVWSAFFLILVLYFRKELNSVWRAFKPKSLFPFFISAVLIGSNWVTYIFAVNSNHIVDASLGYFISPLLQVIAGRIVFREKLSGPQALAFFIATIGVIIVAVGKSTVPVVGLYLAFSFCIYGLIRKRYTQGTSALAGLTVETLVMVPFVAAFALVGANDVTSPVAILVQNLTLVDQGYLIGAGFWTCFPLLLFAMSLSKLPFRTIAFIQYLSPSLQFLIGAFMYGEKLNPVVSAGFITVWMGCGIYLGTLAKGKKRN